jgi:hypothetical protein
VKHGLPILLALHAAMTGAVVLSGGAWATTPLECHTGAMAALLRSGPGWSVFDLWHGAMGSHFLIAMLLVPLGAVLEGGIANQLLAWAGSAGLVAIAYRLLERHLGWQAALCGAAGLAFGPPVVARAAWSLGDWHWTQMIFDYGALLVVLHPRRRWWLLGVVTGLGLANSLGSLPYLGLAWGVALWTSWDRKVVVGIATTLVLATPAWWKLLVHQPFGMTSSGDRTASRLTQLSPDFSKLLDLMGPKLAAALHLDSSLLASLWLAVVWVGVGIVVVGLLRAVRMPLLVNVRWRRAPSLGLLLLLWLSVFLAAYTVLQVRILIGPEEFSNARSATHRLLPPLLGALLVAGGAGWGSLARTSPWALAVGLIPALIGAAAQMTLLGAGTVSDYRGVCFEPLGFFAGQTLQAPSRAFRACDSLSVGQQECRVGAAWGVGFSAAERAHADFLLDRRGRSVLSMGAEPDSAAVCRRVPTDLRAHCLRGFGWQGGAFNWTGVGYPVDACLQLATDDEQAGCWAGVGFPLGDHLGPTPERIGRVLETVDPALRPPIAQGAGYAIGRTWGRPGRAEELCGRIGAHAADCMIGVAEAFDERGGESTSEGP